MHKGIIRKYSVFFYISVSIEFAFQYSIYHVEKMLLMEFCPCCFG